MDFDVRDVNEKYDLFSKCNINSLLYTYLNNGSIENKYMICQEKANRYIISILYSLFKKLPKSVDKNVNVDLLRKYEDRIYNVNGIALTDVQRIKYEFSKIENIDLKTNKFKDDIYFLKEKIYCCINKLDDKKDFMEIKKLIVLLQILTSKNITFFESAYELFVDYCIGLNSIFNDKMLSNNKKENTKLNISK